MYKDIIYSFQKLIDVNTPIIYIQSDDYVRVDEIIFASVQEKEEDQDTTIEEWSPGVGAVSFYNKIKNDEDNFQPLEDFLLARYNRSESKPKSSFIVIKGFNSFIDDANIINLILLMAQRKLYDPKFQSTLILVSPIDISIPYELHKYISYLNIPFPTDDEIDELINRHLEVNGYTQKFRNEDRVKLKPTLKGMTALEIDRMLDMVMSSNGSLSSEDEGMILQQKKQMIKNSGLLELIDTPTDLDSIGGMKALKNYLQRKEIVMRNIVDAQNAGVCIPKGIMLVGMPGCGKSLCAKATAGVFRAPLLRLDIGSMMGKYVGESESNLRNAIKLAEAAAPCILWIDEIEKAFAGVSSGAEAYTTRMFGSFLSWLQDKTSAVYVIATANNADVLPPELKRKGRFDEIFCVNLPNKDECKAIFKVHLSSGNRKDKYADINISDKLIEEVKSRGFNGADIASVVNEAIEKLYIEKKSASSLYDFLYIVAQKTVCIKESCRKQIENMDKAFKENSFIDASTGQIQKSK